MALLKQKGQNKFSPGARKIAWTYLVLIWERLLSAFWPATTLILASLALGLSDLLPLLPGVVHNAALVLILAGLSVTFIWGILCFHRPHRLDVERRLEMDNALYHRPLTVVADNLALGQSDHFTTALWEAHRRHALETLKQLRFPTPHVILSYCDPRALRIATMLLLGLSIIASWGEMGSRLRRALIPAVFNSNEEIAQLDLWIDPPHYTAQAPIFIKAEAIDKSSPTSLAIPIGSKIVARFTGPGKAPILSLGDTRLAFDTISGNGTSTENKNFSKETLLEKDGRLTIYQGWKKLLTLNLTAIPDKIPEATFTAPPAATPRAALKIDWGAKDDYGLREAYVRIRLKNKIATEPASGDTLDLPLPLPADDAKNVTGEAFPDLTAHEWAGLDVAVQIIAVDALGQEGHSEILTTTLPVRHFNNLVAQALVDQRRELTRNEDAAEDAADILDQLVVHPQLYYEDPVVFLGMRIGSKRLRQLSTLETSKRHTELAEIRSLLWDLALRIEEGDMPLAMQDLRASQEALQNALEQNASDPEIEHLIDQLQQALQRYMQALMEEAARQLAEGADLQPVDPSQTIDMQDIQSMLDTLRDMARSGAKDKAKQLLSQMRDLLERLRAAPSLAFDSRRQSAADSMMREMQDLIERQRQLMDKTFQGMNGQQDAQPGPMGQPQGKGNPGTQPGDPTSGQLGEIQQYLRQRLGDIARRMGERGAEIPHAFGKADQAMRDAADALGRGDPGQAVDPQGQALEQLRQGMRSAMEALQQQGQDPGQAFGQEPGNRSDPRMGYPKDDRDPLGRPLSGQSGINNGDVVVPEHGELQRSREILDELRRRAGDPNRPTLERDYIDRLLRQF
ncbi:MAG: TIGR02302 family protein [Alphaproteobacteria bacterium]